MHLLQPLPSVLQRIEFNCALVGLVREPEVVLLSLLKQTGQLENPFVLLVLHLMGLAETALGALDVFIEHVTLFFRALDVGL